MAEKRKRSLPTVAHKKIKLNSAQPVPEIDNTRKEINKYYSKLISKDARDRPKLTQKILGLIGEDLLSASQKHDLCRVLQACLKHGSDAQKSQMVSSLSPFYLDLASGKYSYFLAKKLLKHGDKEELMGKVLENSSKLFGSSYGIRFLDAMYNEGFKSRILTSLLGEEVDGNYDESTVKEMKKKVGIKKMIKKGLLDYTLVINVVYIYSLFSTVDEKHELLSALYDKYEVLFKSRYGTILAIQSLAIADTKQRKAILKTSQSLISYLYDPESYAYLFYIKLVQVVDDTKRVNKMISLPVNQNMKNILKSVNGNKFINNICPYNSTATALSLNELEALEEDLNKTSKKSVENKKTEVFQFIFQTLCKTVTEVFGEIVNDPRLNGVILTTSLGLIHGLGKGQEFVDRCAECCGDWDVIDHAVGHRVLKKVLELEIEAGQKQFAKAYFKVFKNKGDYLEKIIKSRGVWILVSLCEKSGLKNKCKKLLKQLKKKLSSEKSGEKALLEILNNKE